MSPVQLCDNHRRALVALGTSFSMRCVAVTRMRQVQLEALSALTTDGSVSVRLSALAGVREVSRDHGVI